MSCDFCERADFSTFAVRMDAYGAGITLACGSGRFPAEEQFLFCPMCGERIRVGDTFLTERYLTFNSWISLKERLPDPNKRVLCYEKSLKKSATGPYSVQMGQHICGGPVVRRTKVTHWMVLPSPPEVLP